MCMCYLYAELFLTESDQKEIDRESAIVMIDYMLMWSCPVDLQIYQKRLFKMALDRRKYHQTCANMAGL